MRCGCPYCATFMVQLEENASACICPECGYRCNACLGTGTALTREDLVRLRGTDWFTPNFEGASEPGEDITSARPDAPEEF